MNIKYKTLIISLMLIFAIFLFPGCLEDDNENGESKKYFSETYNKTPYILRIEHEQSNDSSYIIIPTPVQKNQTLELSTFQNNSDFNNFSFEFIDTEHGKGLRITPIPIGEFWLWFSCEPYTVKGPFDIKQTDQFYKPNYPGLSTWNTDGEWGYYWFYSSSNLTKLSYRYEYSDCYCFSDKGEIENLYSSSWYKIKNERIQIDMEM
jgi:hypothetical protein